ncbi:serine hydrolase domain-containing protein [Isoptericola sp. NPDC057559]|uniref:serine hydrolase domain-containing protein n=1 Tax=Isoptericola sp. NPDC057559 TaxID=3346168 RepID=UPI0036D1BDF2
MHPGPPLLPRSSPSAEGVPARAVIELLDRLEAASVECHSLMVVRHGRVVAEGWWAPYTADRPHLLYSLTKSFTAVAVGLAVADGLLSLDDRVVDVLPESAPADAPADVLAQGRRLTVHHLLSMTTGHRTDSLSEAWELEPGDLTRGFLRVPFTAPEGTAHGYDNATTYVLARMVERVTGQGLPELLDERVFFPMGIRHAEWDRVASGASFGFHGLHLTTEAVAAFGELLRQGGRWGDRQLVPREWVETATAWHVPTVQVEGWSENPDVLRGYGYQFWRSRHGFRGEGSFGQSCVVVPSHDLVVAVTAALSGGGETLLGPLWECLLPGLDDLAMDDGGDPAADAALAERLRGLALAPLTGSAGARERVTATVDASADGSALADGTVVTVEPDGDGWLLRLGPGLDVEAGPARWRESAPLGRPVVARGAWQGRVFVADVVVITTPHRVRVAVDADGGTAVATWNLVPLTGPDLARHVTAPLMTRPDVA